MFFKVNQRLKTICSNSKKGKTFIDLLAYYCSQYLQSNYNIKVFGLIFLLMSI